VATIDEFDNVFAPYSYKAGAKVKESEMVRNETVEEFSVKPTKRAGSFFWQVKTKAGNKYSFFADTDDKEQTLLATVSPGDAGLFMFEEEHYTDNQGEERTSRKLKGIKEPEVDVNEDMQEKTTPPPTPQRAPTSVDVRVPDVERQTLIVAQNALTNAVVHVGHKLQHALYPGDMSISVGDWSDNEVLRLRKLFLDDTLKHTGK
jgi:hypothetical protein